MAEPIQSTATAEERQKQIDEKTSVGRYAMKQLQTTGIPLLGGVAGWFAGLALLKNARIAQWAEKTMPLADRFESGKVFTGISAFVTASVASIFNTYEHWKNSESEKLAVSEINTDVGNLVQERSKFSETLNRQESLIKELIAERQKAGTFTDRTTEAGTTESVR